MPDKVVPVKNDEMLEEMHHTGEGDSPNDTLRPDPRKDGTHRPATHPPAAPVSGKKA